MALPGIKGGILDLLFGVVLNLACIREMDGPFSRTPGFTPLRIPTSLHSWLLFTLSTLFVFAGQVFLHGLCSSLWFYATFSASSAEVLSNEQRVQSFEDQHMEVGRRGGKVGKDGLTLLWAPIPAPTRVCFAHSCVLIPSTMTVTCQ